MQNSMWLFVSISRLPYNLYDLLLFWFTHLASSFWFTLYHLLLLLEYTILADLPSHPAFPLERPWPVIPYAVHRLPLATSYIHFESQSPATWFNNLWLAIHTYRLTFNPLASPVILSLPPMIRLPLQYPPIMPGLVLASMGLRRLSPMSPLARSVWF